MTGGGAGFPIVSIGQGGFASYGPFRVPLVGTCLLGAQSPLTSIDAGKLPASDASQLLIDERRRFPVRHINIMIIPLDNIFATTKADWKAGKRTWRETTAEAYEYALCVLPPDYRKNRLFAMGEIYDHSPSGEAIYYFFTEDQNNRFFAIMGTIRAARNDLLPNIPE